MILLMFFYIFNVDVLACVLACVRNRKPKLIWEMKYGMYGMYGMYGIYGMYGMYGMYGCMGCMGCITLIL